MSTPVKPDDAEVAADGKPIPQPTLSEAYFMLNIIKFINGKLDTDWAKVAEAQGLKNAETAKVRFGQIKKKLNFASATPATTRARPQKRGAAADTDESGTTPAEKKPRKTPAKPRAKKQPAGGGGSSAPASSPTAAEDESPLAAKSGKKAHHKTAPVPSGLNDGNSYAVSGPAGNSANEYLAASAPLTGGNGNGDGNGNTKAADKIKPEPSDSSDDETQSNANTKVDRLLLMAPSEPSSPDQSKPLRHPLPSSAPSAFGLPNNFLNVNMLAPLNAQEVQATSGRQQGQGPAGQTPRQLRDAAAQQAMAAAQADTQGHSVTASTASLRGLVPHTGGGQITTIQAHHGAHAAQHAGGGGDGHTAHDPDVEEDMTLPPRDDDPDDQSSAFNAAMYGTGGGAIGGLFGWPNY